MNAFEITIQRKAEGGWPVVVRHQPGERELTLWSRGWLDLDLKALVPLLPSDKAYGLLLGKALFRKDIRDAFVRADAKAKDADKPLRVLLNVEADDLRRLHWEQLHAPLDRGWDYLLLNQGTPFSLYLPSQIQLRFPPIGRRDLRALLLVAGPEELNRDYGLAPFGVAATVGSIQNALGEVPCDVLATVGDAIGPPTLNALCEHLTAGRYTLLHLVCHGKAMEDSGETVLYFPGDKNRRPVKATTLIEHLGRLGRIPHLTFLSTCESADPQAEAGLGGLGQRLVRELGIPAVVAMTDRISTDTAEALASVFYGCLREHGEVDRALGEALAGLQGRYDVTVPALFSRLGGRALWSDTLDRPLTEVEIRYGLEQMPRLLEQRAPILLPEFGDHSAKILASLGLEATALSAETRHERTAALAAVNQLCSQALDLSFNALALGHKPPDYDSRCPFPGLSAFGVRFLASGEKEQDDREFFFGREVLIERLKEKLAEHNFLPILGPSGSGKSSLVVAGLIPALQKEEPQLQMAYLTPGRHPLDKLETSRSEAVGESAILVADQFEELFTLCADEGERRAFLDRLLALAAEMRVVIAMRADFWGDCALYPILRAEMQAWQELIAPMDASELRAAMERQASEVGLRFEADLSKTILDDVRGEPGAMPLLQHALLELWNRRHGRWLLAEEYRDGIGGVQQAIAYTADVLYKALSGDDQKRMRDIFVRLTRLGEEAVQDAERRDTRQRVRFRELVPAGGDPAPTRMLVQRLADARLIVTGPWATPVEGQTLEDSAVKVEVAHEALIRHWPRLRGWLDEDRADLRLRQGVRQAALEWEANDQDEAYLVHKRGRLEDAEALSRQPHFALSKLEQAYLSACVDLRKEELAAKARAARRLGRLAIILLVVFLLAVGAAVIAGVQRKQAANNAATAEAAAAGLATEVVVRSTAEAELVRQADALSTQVVRRSTAEALALDREATAVAAQTAAIAYAGAEATARADADRQAQIALSRQRAAQSARELGGNQYEVALPLAIEAGRAADTAEAFAALREAIAHPGRTRLILSGHEGSVYQAVWSADGSRILTASGDGTARVWDPATGDELLILSGHEGGVYQAVWSADESRILTRSDDDTARVWDAGTGAELLTLSGHEGGVVQAAWNADESRILTASGDGMARVWDAGTGAELLTLSGHEDAVYQAVWNADESRILTASLDDTARVWDAGTGAEVLTLSGHEDPVLQAAWSADGSRILTASYDGTARVWDAGTGAEVLTLSGHEGPVFQATWNADGSRILTASYDGTARVWDAGTGVELLPLSGHEGSVVQAAWNADESCILTAGEDGTARVWDAGTGDELLILRGHEAWVYQAAWNADESRILTASDDDTARVWDAGTGAELLTLSGHKGSVNQATWNAAESRILTASSDRTARVWDAGTGAELLTLSGHEGSVDQAAWSADGSRILTASYDGAARVWDAGTGAELLPLSGHVDRVYQAVWNADESRILTASSDRTARVWDAATGAELLTLAGHERTVVQAVWNADESRILTASYDGTARVWDAGTGAELLVLSGHDYAVYQAAWNADGSRILTASYDGTARVWDAATGAELLTLSVHKGSVNQATWSADGSRILTASSDRTARVWDAATGVELLTLAGHGRVVNQATWNADGSRILTASDDGTARVWDAGTGVELFTLAGHTNRVSQAAWNADGSRILTASYDRTARVWYTRMEDLIEAACRIAPRNLTRAEWRQYMKGEAYRATCENLPLEE